MASSTDPPRDIPIPMPRRSVKTFESKEDIISSQMDTSLPQTFKVKFLGKKTTEGLWGIKFTRAPVDAMVHSAKTKGETLPVLRLKVTKGGVEVRGGDSKLEVAKERLESMDNPNRITVNGMNVSPEDTGFLSVDTISYGVQDIIYTHVFAMIVVKNSFIGQSQPGSSSPVFHCYAYVCDSGHTARRLTFALAAAFQEFSKSVKQFNQVNSRRLAIDLRSPDEIKSEYDKDSEA